MGSLDYGLQYALTHLFIHPTNDIEAPLHSGPRVGYRHDPWLPVICSHLGMEQVSTVQYNGLSSEVAHAATHNGCLEEVAEVGCKE